MTITVSRLRRSFSFRTAFSLAFADVSPIVALYAIFGLGLFAAGPAFFWAFPVVLAGQLLVAAVFGELSSRWPFAGSVYQWATHLRGSRWGWAAAWAYIWGLTVALSTLAYGAAGFLLPVFGVENPSRTLSIAVALVILVAGTVTNMVGRRVLKVMVTVSILCEVLGSIGLGTVLLLFYRVNPVSVLFEGVGAGGQWLSGPFLMACAYVGFSFVGFEAAGSIAEEVDRPERNVPRAIILSLLCVGFVVIFASAALLLATPDLARVVAAGGGDPVTATLTAHFGGAIVKPLLIMFVIGFVSSFLAVQAAVSRAVFGSARDGALPGARLLATLTGRERLPVHAIGLVALVAAAVLLLAGSELYGVLVNMTAVGFQIAFAVPVIGAAVTRLRERWVPGAFSLGRWGAPVTYLAALWLIVESVNIVWPRGAPGSPWYVTWAMPLMTALLAAAGLVVYAVVRKRIAEPLAVRLAREEGR
ncbi:amino acid permease [Pseudonocardia acaciae]|uniref:amino acid permease n=1 Tax=Pseudonocardia acaciae TaxID=551276 RepID=UPI0005665E4A|nr:amino acid permease [Pseudonocardia acaciae]